MKKVFALMVLVAAFIACQQEKKPVPVDLNAAKAEVTALLDKWNGFLKAKDAAGLVTLLAADGLYLGTDPKEFWPKDQYSEMVKQVLADTSLVFDYTIDRTELLMAADGNSCLSVEQTIINFISKKIPVRVIMREVKTNGEWKVDFYSSSLIPLNEDLPKLNQALD
jgi:hypothetical protein